MRCVVISVVFEGETIEGAPPLWCAAAAGHLSVVRFLVQRGANINATTRTHSTPLRAACFDGHFEIVKFLISNGANIEVSNRHGHTCLMIACYKGHYKIAQYLLSLGAKVNTKSVKGNTALHDCAESGSLDILKMLIRFGATIDVDCYGMTPLLAASVTGHTDIVEYLITHEDRVTRQECIDALELLGATYVDKKRDMFGALELWKRAMHLRSDERMPIAKPAQPVTVEAYEHSREIRTLEELDDLLADPDEMRMQSLLIRERILGPAHPDTSYYIRYRGAVYADAGKFSRCISLWSYALDMQQQMLDSLNPMTQSSLFSFTELFSYMMGEEGRSNARGRRVPTVTFEDIVQVLERAVREVGAGVRAATKPGASADITQHLNRVLVIALHLACLFGRLSTPITSDQRHLANSLIYQLVKMNVRGLNGQTPLHIACSSEATLVGRYPACSFPSVQLVKMLMAVGAEPNATDDQGNTPLHIAARLQPCSTALAKALLDGGAHLDTVDQSGRTFRDYQPTIYNSVQPLNYLRLTCLAAQAVKRNAISCTANGELPVTLLSLLHHH
ncbi:protein fem-1 homolog CG6966 isoform X1 [Nilaparvata lugens]|uniref:protein fem-1 homolog CG6966 isoform X1 n=1 Tax=Nilaparvata lugens TaxID=108931 RepID=UPI00193EA6B1|nr:protein fem-1 homolog CG6966 isoform X1 [Nilaparvata lugens]